MALEPKLLKLPIVKRAEFRRQAPESPDKPELRGDDVDDQTKPSLPGKLEAVLGFTLDLSERISRGEKDRVQVVATDHRISEVPDLVRGLERPAHKVKAGPDMFGPRYDQTFRNTYRSWPGSA